MFTAYLKHTEVNERRYILNYCKLCTMSSLFTITRNCTKLMWTIHLIDRDTYISLFHLNERKKCTRKRYIAKVALNGLHFTEARKSQILTSLGINKNAFEIVNWIMHAYVR